LCCILFVSLTQYIVCYHNPVLFIQFTVGATGVAITNSIQTLMVDMFPGRSASIMASNNLIRCLFGAGATVLIDPALQALGVGWVSAWLNQVDDYIHNHINIFFLTGIYCSIFGTIT
jgi:hypothetical protein